MTDDAIRALARNIGLVPEVSGHTNVQDAIAAGGGVVLGNYSSDQVAGDAATPLTGDGASHNVDCLIAAPPAWMDNAGHIIAPGLYNCLASVTATAGPTTPNQFIQIGRVFNAQDYLACDALGAAGNYRSIDIQALAQADLPYLVENTIVMPTDATEAIIVSQQVIRLAY